MSNNRDLLKEAIADAKAVKETAIANAKAALEEAFTPHLKSMLSAKLEGMDMDEDIDEGYDKYEEDDVTKEEVSEEVEAVEENEEVTESEEVTEAEEIEEEIDLDELLAELNETEEVTESEEIEEAKKEIDEAKDDKEDDKEDVKESEEIEESEEVTEEEEVVAEEEGEDEEAEGEMEEEEIDLEDMSEDDLKGFIENVIKDMVEAGELEAGEEMEMDGEESEMDMDIEVEDEEAPMMEEEEKLEEMDEVSWNEKNNPTRGASKKELDPKKVGKSTSAYAVNLEEVMAEVNDLKQELQEVNLLNAKLLYTNKIFKAKNLSEDKKVKVLKAFDKAETVKEAKVIFETLNEGLVSKTEAQARPQGSASKATGTITEAKKQPIVENAAFARMQKLAGIIKEN